jgi:hypothetical protein
MFGIPVQIRRNCDSIWLFVGMIDKMMFSMIMSQLGLNGKDWWEEYSDLNYFYNIRNRLLLKIMPVELTEIIIQSNTRNIANNNNMNINKTDTNTTKNSN